MEEKEPETGALAQRWWHHHGMKMKVKTYAGDKDIVKIEGSAAWLSITKAKYNEGWLIKWRINHDAHVSEVSGTAWFSDDNLKRAFGLRDDIPEFADWLIAQYGGTTASQGCFIRYKNFLNIPCPGTGHDGGPNISLELTDDIKEAVGKLIKSQKQRGKF